jgi:hypothetical protein
MRSAIELPDAYPLAWPAGWQMIQVGQRKRSQYGLAFTAARARLLKELRQLGATRVVLSTNQPVRGDGLPYARASEPLDAAAAVYWIGRDGAANVMACSKWMTLRDNVRALGLAVEALRQLERCGASEILERAFIGFRALASENPPRPWSDVLGVDQARTTLDCAEAKYRLLARSAHPDAGGSHERMVELNRAWEQARRELR